MTQGCDKWLDIVRDETIGRCLAGLEQRGFRLYAAVPGAATSLEELDPLVPAAFLIGNEHDGLSAAARAACDVEFAIPMHGFSQSVNVSVATALCVYTHAAAAAARARRGRRSRPPPRSTPARQLLSTRSARRRRHHRARGESIALRLTPTAMADARSVVK